MYDNVCMAFVNPLALDSTTLFEKFRNKLYNNKHLLMMLVNFCSVCAPFADFFCVVFD